MLVFTRLGSAAVPEFAHNWPTRLQQGLLGTLVVLLPYPAPKTAHRAAQGRVWFFSSKTSLPLPLKGEGRGIAFLGFVGFALLVHNWVTLAQQGRSRALLVSLPYPTSKIAHRATQERVWHPFPFPGMLWVWQG